ncbi:MAG: phospholipase D family protein [Verrucomicrobiia bacterium]
MTSRTIAQPSVQLGQEIDALLENETNFVRIIFVSAFVALRTILRLRDRLLTQSQGGCRLRLTVGIDLGGTSKDVLEELLRWNCEVFVFHNPISRATFHPKVYLFESSAKTTVIVGSNNLTDGGFYTNYEAAVRYDFQLPSDAQDFERIIEPLLPFIEPHGVTVQSLTADLINTLVIRGLVTTEAQARENRRNQAERQQRPADQVLANPFQAVAVPNPPLLPQNIRVQEPVIAQIPLVTSSAEQGPAARPEGGLLVWSKTLPRTDALQVNEGSHHVGGVRLTQAEFENLPGQRIDQTTYFRNLFGEFHWENEKGRQGDQEHTFIPMRIFIWGRDYGIRNFEISHKPSGEAGQANYTTILRWGREFTPTIIQENVTGLPLSLYETPDAAAPFLIELT